MMKITDITAVIGILISASLAIMAFVTLSYVTTTFSRGPVPQKELTYLSIGGADAMASLSNSGGAISVEVKSGGDELHNLYIMTTILKNDGQAPIQESDISKPLTLETTKPWKIIAVNSQSTGEQIIPFPLRKVSDTEFISEKSLINPGDNILETVYMTYEGINAELPPPLFWKARIANLPSIKTQENTVVALGTVITVQLFGYGIIFTLISFSVYFALYLYLIGSLGAFAPFRLSGVVIAVLSGLVSISAAEAGNSYVFGPTLFQRRPDALINVPFLALNAILLIALVVAYVRANKRKAAP